MVHQFLNNEYGGMSTTVSVWDFERNLLAQMIRFPATYAGSTEAEQYYSGKVNSAVWKFAKAERMLHDAAIISLTEQQSLSQLYASNTALLDSLGIIEQLEGVDTTTANSAWLSRFGQASTAMASGWMLTRETRRSQSVEHGFPLSDHADWPGLLKAIQETQAEQILVTHGHTGPMVKCLTEQGKNARAIATRFAGERESDESEVAVEAVAE